MTDKEGKSVEGWKITTLKEVSDFSKGNLKRLVQEHINDFNRLKKGDILCMLNFFKGLCADEKAEVFATTCPLMIANRKNLLLNTGVRILTPEELKKELEGDGT